MGPALKVTLPSLVLPPADLSVNTQQERSEDLEQKLERKLQEEFLQIQMIRY